VEELAGCHEQQISDLEIDVTNKVVYIKALELNLASLTSRVDMMEGRLCRCDDAQVVEEVEEDNHSDLSYASQYWSPVNAASLLKDVPCLISIGDVKVT